MCWEDILMSRKFRTRYFSTGAAVVVQPNAKRIGVWVGGTQGECPQVSVNLGIISQPLWTAGFNIAAGGSFQVESKFIPVEQVGDLLLGPLTLTATQGAGNAWLLDVFAIEEYKPGGK